MSPSPLYTATSLFIFVFICSGATPAIYGKFTFALLYISLLPFPTRSALMALSLEHNFQCTSCKRPWQPLLYTTCDTCRQKRQHHWRRHHPLTVAGHRAPRLYNLSGILLICSRHLSVHSALNAIAHGNIRVIKRVMVVARAVVRNTAVACSQLPPLKLSLQGRLIPQETDSPGLFLQTQTGHAAFLCFHNLVPINKGL